MHAGDCQVDRPHSADQAQGGMSCMEPGSRPSG